MTNPISRRRFLKTASAFSAFAVAGWHSHSAEAAKVKIEKIETFPMIYPVIGRFKFFEGGKGQPSGRAAVLVKITADNGTIGWGQSVPIPK